MKMNTLELQDHLMQMAKNNNTYAINYCMGIINAIIAHYLTYSGYYEDHAIATFKGFFENGKLTW